MSRHEKKSRHQLFRDFAMDFVAELIHKVETRFAFDRLALRNTMLRQASPEIACSQLDPASPNSFFMVLQSCHVS